MMEQDHPKMLPSRSSRKKRRKKQQLDQSCDAGGHHDQVTNATKGTGRQLQLSAPPSPLQPSNKKRHPDVKQQHQRMPTPPPLAGIVSKMDRQKKHEEALALSQQLRLLSSQKRMQECLNLYRSSTNDELRDAHHGSIVVDCCARCGDTNEAERVVNEMILTSQSDPKLWSWSSKKKPQRFDHKQPHYFWEDYSSKQHVPIQAWTALLKGYVHSGMIQKADSLFNYLCNVHNQIAPGGRKKRKKDGNEDGPNVRTLNTLLRGCLWTATSLNVFSQSKDNNDIKLVGGVITAGRAWSLCEKVNIRLDSSSYEYFITLLSQALRLNDAENCLKKMMGEYSSKDGGDNDELDQTIIESLVVCLVAIARGYALLGKEKDVMRCADEALKNLHSLDSSFTKTSGTESAVSNESNLAKRLVTGGKKAWKEQNTTMNSRYDKSTGRRDESNKLFRNHRLSELRSEASLLQKLSSTPSQSCIVTRNASYVAQFMLTRLLYFSGGGTTGKDATIAANSTSAVVTVEETTQQWINSLWTSFGLKETVHRLLQGRDPSLVKLFLNSSSKEQDLPPFLSSDVCIGLREHITGKESILSDTTGSINFTEVFISLDDHESTSLKRMPQQNRKIHIELGAGAGDWACLQASLNPSDNYVTVELRADRVAQTFAKSLLHQKQTTGGSSVNTPLTNICCVGSECGSFLRDRVEEGSVKTIFVNHPEPPTQTYNDANVTSGEEPAHMLNSQTIISAARCLEPFGRGRLIIVTDNLIYARFICHNLARMISEDKLNLLGLHHAEVRDLTLIESFGRDSIINLYEGKPSKSIGHSVPNSLDGGTSYFDRLWRTGAGKYAEMRKRYIICLKTSSDGTEHRLKSMLSVEEQKDSSSHNMEEEKRTGKKKGADKQRRRNERRLLKKQQLDIR